MKSKKYIKVLLLAFIVNIINPNNFAYANELEQQIFEDVAPENSIENLKNYDIASGKEIFEYLISSQSNAEEFIFGKEFLKRLELAKEIAILKKIDPDDSLKILEESTSILNSDDLDKIKEQSSKLHGLSIDFANKKGLILAELSEEETKDLEEKTKNYLNYGLLFDFAKKNDFDLFTKAILNSKAYFMADDKQKALYEAIIQELSLDKSTEKKENEENYKTLVDFVKAEDKKAFFDNIKKEKEKSSTADPKRVKILEIEDNTTSKSTDINGHSLLAANDIKPSSSAFLNNEKTKDLYEKLSDAQKKEIDLIDTDKNGMISDGELDNSTNYSSDLDENSWIYPFTEKSLSQNKEETVALKETPPEVDNNQSNENSQSQIPTNNPPQTVTIDKSTKAPELNKEKPQSESKKETSEKHENISAAKIVKTGISSVWIFALILVLAVGLFYVLDKNKKNK